jgi:hypothetical protein
LRAAIRKKNKASVTAADAKTPPPLPGEYQKEWAMRISTPLSSDAKTEQKKEQTGVGKIRCPVG